MGYIDQPPYRGQAHPKLRGHPSPPPRPHIKWFMLVAGLTFVFIGIYLGYHAIIEQTFLSIFYFVVYLIFVGMLIFAIRDVKKIKTITPEENILENGHSLFALARGEHKKSLQKIYYCFLSY